MPTPGYNARARQSSSGASGSRKKGKLRRARADGQSSGTLKEDVDPNALISVPKSAEQKERERKERMRQEMIEQSQSKMNSKKKKRLEKYIDKKLRKEEKLALLEKISQSQSSLSTALALHSSATLGTGHPSTAQARFQREEDREVRRAMEGRVGKRKRRREEYTVVDASGSESEQADSEENVDMDGYEGRLEERKGEGSSRVPAEVIVAESSTAALSVHPTTSEVGTALKRNPDGSIVQPIIKPKKSKAGNQTVFQSWKTRRNKGVLQSEKHGRDSDTSFDSSDSAYDSPDDEQIVDAKKAEKQAERGPSAEGESNSEEDEDSEGASGSSETSDTSSEEEEADPQPKRKLGFKDWALQQLSTAKGYDAPVPSDSPAADVAAAADAVAVAEDEPAGAAPPPQKKRKLAVRSGDLKEGIAPMGEDLQFPATPFALHLQKTAKEPGNLVRRKIIPVSRTPEIREARMHLPIVAEEQAIMEAILLNPVVVICGETGSGKTTQVPQFLYEAGFGSPGTDNPGMIGITQPRRVAAMSMAARVARELSLPPARVSYQIRYDATVSPSTSIKFMTDGVLLRELAQDFLLQRYSVVIVDEAHERSLNTDILIGVLSRVVRLREEMWREGKDGVKPLRLIIMSATLRVSDFAANTTLFPSPPPVLNISARQHPVTVHFSRRTFADYVTEAMKKAAKIHARLPPGGILIFLTGQNEIAGVCRKLESRYGRRAIEEKKRRRREMVTRVPPARETELDTFNDRVVAPAQADVEAEEMELGDMVPGDLSADVDDGDVADDSEALESDEDALENEELGIDLEETEAPMHVVPLYSLLPSEKQMRVFEEPPEGTRLIVVATNIAETSLTIPGIRYVVDSGRAKERKYDPASGVQSFQVSWVSKASAAQRAGRAGRTGPGHCYRLYSSALFETHFAPFAEPEILRAPIEGVVLQMKAMHIDAVVNFPFPTPPDRAALLRAEKVLTYLGALRAPDKSSGWSKAQGNTVGGQISDLGRAMSLFPLHPRFSRMLVSGRQHDCLPYVICIVAALSIGDPFLHEEGLKGEGAAGDDDDDDDGEPLAHIKDDDMRAKEARKSLRRAYYKSMQAHASLGKFTSDVFKILSIVGAYEYAGGGHVFCAEHFVRPKAMEEIHKLRGQISDIVRTNFGGADAGYTSDFRPPNDLQVKILRQLLAAAFIDQVAARKDLVEKSSVNGAQFASAKGIPYRAMGIPEDIFIHPSSILIDRPPPDYVVFHELVRTTKVWLKGATIVNPAWLSSLGKPALCTFSKPVKNNSGTMMTVPHFGPDGWELPAVKADTSI